MWMCRVGHRRRWLGLVCVTLWASVMALYERAALAQQAPEAALMARPVGLDGLPGKIGDASVSAEGDLLLVHDASSKPQPKAISRVIAASTMFQIDPVVFTEPGLG